MKSTKKIKEILKKKLSFLYSIYSKHLNDVMIVNYFNTSFTKNILISYITHPFKNEEAISHTNVIESLKVAEVFRELGYNCDIVNFSRSKAMHYEKYDGIFGFGKPLHNSFRSKKKIFRIFYGTGRHPHYNNQETINRGIVFLKRKKIFLYDSLRLIDEDYSLQINASDALVLLGGEDVKQNFKKYTNQQKIHTLNTSFYKIHDYKDIIDKRDYRTAKSNFLFFGGSGMIHKGLDLLLEAFKDRDDIDLFVCAPLDNEEGFKKLYKKELYYTKNIHTYNFIALDSNEFKNIIAKCCFVILPSCSEVMPTSIVNAVGNGGLIPVLTKVSTINIDELSIIIDRADVESILNALELAKNMSIDDIRKNSIKLGKKVNSEYTINVFKNCFKEKINTILNSLDLNN